MQIHATAIQKAARAFWNRLLWTPDPNRGIALALGGGFARGVAHVGVLRVLERERIPISAIAGVSAGSIVAAAFAGGADSALLEVIARSMKFTDVAGWQLSRLGIVGSGRMETFLKRALPVHRFEEMLIPLTVVATDLGNGQPVLFQDHGEIFNPLRASCSYPGLFQPVLHNGRILVDGAISMEIPAAPLKTSHGTPVVSVALPPPESILQPTSVFGVVNRCFQIMQRRTERYWREHSDVIIAPQVCGVSWDDFSQVNRLIEAGMAAAELALPQIRKLLPPTPVDEFHVELRTHFG